MISPSRCIVENAANVGVSAEIDLTCCGEKTICVDASILEKQTLFPVKPLVIANLSSLDRNWPCKTTPC
ncbi:hypothetical protein O9992_18520 [Vibrio lentus]|nr:hypothetical protein [Vibrio lentus]